MSRVNLRRCEMEPSEYDGLYAYLSKGEYPIAIVMRTRREYLGEKLRILELTMVNCFMLKGKVTSCEE